jgi:hypothetical protein
LGRGWNHLSSPHRQQKKWLEHQWTCSMGEEKGQRRRATPRQSAKDEGRKARHQSMRYPSKVQTGPMWSPKRSRIGCSHSKNEMNRWYPTYYFCTTCCLVLSRGCSLGKLLLFKSTLEWPPSSWTMRF